MADTSAPAAFDVRAQLITTLKDVRPQITSAVRSRTAEALRGLPHSRFITFVVGNRVYEPAASLDYAKVLWAFVRQQTFDGQEVNSIVGRDVSEAVEKAIGDTMGKPEFGNAVAAAFRGGHASAVDNVLRDDIEWLTREFKVAAGLPGGETLQTKIALMTVEQISLFFKTAAGAAVLAAFAHVAATTMGKVLIFKAVKLAFLKVSGSVVLKTLAIGIAKKVGIAIIIKTLLTGLILHFNPKLRLDKLAPPLLLVAVAGLITHAIWTFPSKVAEQAPGEIATKIDQQWPELSTTMADTILFEMAQMNLAEIA
jgi:hypothetical protein